MGTIHHSGGQRKQHDAGIVGGRADVDVIGQDGAGPPVAVCGSEPRAGL
jgi:hypothetical protein